MKTAKLAAALQIENLLSELLQKEPEISAPAKALLEKIDPAGIESWTPNSFSHQIRKSVAALGGATMLSSEIMNTHAPMHLRLELKKRCELFWLKDIRDVDISQCCAKCFIGQYDPNFWDATHGKSEGVIDIYVRQNPRAKAYYLCGLSDKYVWSLNTHVAFVPDSNSEVHIENDRIKLDITNARRINFWDYVPNPPGNYTRKQRTCRNWIFANYIKDGMPL